MCFVIKPINVNISIATGLSESEYLTVLVAKKYFYLWLGNINNRLAMIKKIQFGRRDYQAIQYIFAKRVF